jgi:hypothetical protein
MTLPFVPHDFLVADENTLAEAVEGEVGSVCRILRMFETSFRRLFLKFERFSSLRKSCAVVRKPLIAAAIADCAWRSRAADQANLVPRAMRPAIVAPSFGKGPFTIPGECARPRLGNCPDGGCGRLARVLP